MEQQVDFGDRNSRMEEKTFDLIPENVRIFGRTLSLAGALWLGSSGSGVEFETSAPEVKADILGVSSTNDITEFAYLGVFIDDAEEMSKRFEVRRDLRTYELFSNPDGESHRVRLVKLTESKRDKVALSCLRASEGMVPAGGSSRKILFIGDSLVAGYGVLGEHHIEDDPDAYTFTTREQDVTKSFAWQTAYRLDAEAEYFCWSGNGIISRSIEKGSDVPVTDQLMPTLLPYVDKDVESTARIYLRAHGWKDPDPSMRLTQLTDRGPDAFRPELIVSNLGTNDAGFTKGISVREQHFGQKYLEMLREVQRIYPLARILIVYGLMETSLSDVCNEVALMGDYQYLQLPLMNPKDDGIGGGGHPGIVSHAIAAQVLSDKVHDMMGWDIVHGTQEDVEGYYLDD